MTKFLVDKGARIDHQCDKTGWHPMYIAATQGTLECLEFFINLGVDVNKETYMKRTALTKSAWIGRVDAVKILLKHPKINLE